MGHKSELIRQRDEELLQVKQHIRAAARMGATSPLKVMLNQEDPNSVRALLVTLGTLLRHV